MRGSLLALGALLIAAPAAAQTFTGTTTLNDPVYNRPLAGTPPTGLSGVGTAVHYNLLPFTVTTSGSYSFLLTGLTPVNWDTFLGLHAGSFSPTSPLSTAVVYNDDFPGIGRSGFTASLLTGTSYFGVITGFDNDDVGAWSLVITGPGRAVTGAGAVPEPSSWALMIIGFGAVGGAMRRRSVKVSYA